MTTKGQIPQKTSNKSAIRDDPLDKVLTGRRQGYEKCELAASTHPHSFQRSGPENADKGKAYVYSCWQKPVAFCRAYLSTPKVGDNIFKG
jgi:hypothetical protein